MKEITVYELLNTADWNLKVEDINKILWIDITNKRYKADYILEITIEQYNKLFFPYDQEKETLLKELKDSEELLKNTKNK